MIVTEDPAFRDSTASCCFERARGSEAVSLGEFQNEIVDC
jgi:hypothetical protein